MRAGEHLPARVRKIHQIGEQDGRIGKAVGDRNVALADPANDRFRQDVQQQRFGLALLDLQLVDERQLAIAQPLSLQGCFNARAEQHRIEGFRNVIFGARLDATHDAVDLVQRRDHHDRNMLDSWIGLKPVNTSNPFISGIIRSSRTRSNCGFGHRLEGRSATVSRVDGMTLATEPT